MNKISIKILFEKFTGKTGNLIPFLVLFFKLTPISENIVAYYLKINTNYDPTEVWRDLKASGFLSKHPNLLN